MVEYQDEPADPATYLPPPGTGMMMQVTLYSDATLTIDGRCKQEAVPYVLRQIADALESGSTVLTDIPMN